jgi:TRAP transporter TAXI family solute receptor
MYAPALTDAVRRKQDPCNQAVINGQGGAFFYVNLNVTNPIFADKLVRQAMSYALHRDRIAGSVLQGLVGIAIDLPWRTSTPGLANRTIQRERDVTFTKQPIMAGACPTCIWGPLAAWTRDAVQPYGYKVRVCWNCNRQLSVPTVAAAMDTPPLLPEDIALGDPAPPKGKVDFGVTNSHTLWRAYEGDGYQDGPQKHLRLLAYIEDVHLIQAVAKKSSGVKTLEDIAHKRLKVTLALDGSPFIADIISHYGLDQLESWGGNIKRGFGGQANANRSEFDVLITAHGGLAGNIENDLMYEITQKFDLEYLPFSPELTEYMVKRHKLEVAPVPRGLLRGLEKPMTTLARNGQSVYSREDLPDDFAYIVARALDESRGVLKYLNRPYYYDSRTVWRGVGTVPLHPGAERYYRETGYLRQAA